MKWFSIQTARNFIYFSSRGKIPVIMLGIAILMVKIIIVQSASVTTENSRATDETSTETEKNPDNENIIRKFCFAIYNISTTRNGTVILVISAVGVLFFLVFKLTSIDKIFRKKPQIKTTKYNILEEQGRDMRIRVTPQDSGTTWEELQSDSSVFDESHDEEHLLVRDLLRRRSWVNTTFKSKLK